MVTFPTDREGTIGYSAGYHGAAEAEELLRVKLSLQPNSHCVNALHSFTSPTLDEH